MSNEIDAFDAFAQDWETMPEDAGGGSVKPPVWVLSEVVSAEAAMSKFGYPQIKYRTKIIRSAAAEGGERASGSVTDFLSKVSSSADMASWRKEREQAKFKKAMICFFAPEYFGCKEDVRAARDAQIRVNAGGGSFDAIASSMVGKRLLQKLTVNDGKKADGTVHTPQRVDDPRNEIWNVLPATEKFMKYVDGAQAPEAGTL